MSAQKKKEFLRAITNFVVNRQKSLRTSCFYDRIVERTVKSGRGRNYHAENCRRYQVRRRQQHICLETSVRGFQYEQQLIVHESQEAIFFMNGLALDLFGPGRYTLETQNIPLYGILSICLLMVCRRFIVKSILSTKRSKWLSGGERTARFSTSSLLINFLFRLVQAAKCPWRLMILGSCW